MEPAQGKARLNGITNPSTTVRDSKSRTAENAQDNHSPPETSSGQVVWEAILMGISSVLLLVSSLLHLALSELKGELREVEEKG